MLRQFIEQIREEASFEARQDSFAKAMQKPMFASALVVCTDMKLLKELVTLLRMDHVRTKQPQTMVRAIRAFVGSYKKCAICKAKTPLVCASCQGEDPKHVHLGCTLDKYPILAVKHGFAVPGAVDAPRCQDCARSAIKTILDDVPNVKKKTVKQYFQVVLGCNSPDAVCVRLLS